MSEPENNTGETEHTTSIVVVESEPSKHALPYRPLQLTGQDTPGLHQKCAPAVSCGTMTFSDVEEVMTENWQFYFDHSLYLTRSPAVLKRPKQTSAIRDLIENETVVAEKNVAEQDKNPPENILKDRKKKSETGILVTQLKSQIEQNTLKQVVAEVHSSRSNLPEMQSSSRSSITAISSELSKKLSLTSEEIPMKSFRQKTEIDPAMVMTEDEVVKPISKTPSTDDIEQLKDSEADSMTSDTADMRTSDWSDDEEATGLPRSESRSSRVTRAVRQLLCCGMQLEAASEDKLSSPRSGLFHSGI